jgi:glycosyltransferase involved in cell wall biosynthesis
MNASPEDLPLTIITHEFFPTKGGIATFVEEIALASHQLGRTVEVWAPQGRSNQERTFPFPVRRVPLRGTQDLACQVRMASEMIRHRRVLRRGAVYLPEPGPLLAMTYLQFFKAFKPARLLLTFHGSEVQSFSSRPAARVMVGRLVQIADRISTPSLFVKRLVGQRFPAALAKTVVTRGAPRSAFLAVEPAPIKTSDKIVVLAVGRLHPRKGQLLLLEALDSLPHEITRRVEFWIVGRGRRGDYEARLRRRAAEAGVPVVFLGNIDDDDLQHIYRRADIFAMTSVNHGHSLEGFGLAYMEASAFGLPVVAHDVGGVSEAVIDGKTGLLVEPGNVGALAAALAKLIGDRALRERLGSAGASWARNHSWRESARALMDGIEDQPAPIAESSLVLSPS